VSAGLFGGIIDENAGAREAGEDFIVARVAAEGAGGLPIGAEGFEGVGCGERERRLGVRDVSEQCAREQTEG
jgi:hypothetical protein